MTDCAAKKILRSAGRIFHGRVIFCAVTASCKRGMDAIGTTRNEINLTTEAGAKNFILDKKPETVIHCAAYTAVDKAESDAELALTVNGLGTRWIAEACREVGAKMIYISTDYVFGGDGRTPYEVHDEKNPVNVYGRSKLLGEDAVSMILHRHFIVRVSWVFGVNGKNFVKTMLRLAETKKILRVVNDQFGSPTYTADLAKLLADMAATDKFGIYHATNEGGFISWYDFAREIFAQAGVKMNVIPVSTAEYGLSKAKRPSNSRLDKTKLRTAGFTPLPDWRDALRRYLANGTD